MEAVAALLRGLPLQPEESDRGDLMDAKSALFLKYNTTNPYSVHTFTLLAFFFLISQILYAFYESLKRLH